MADEQDVAPPPREEAPTVVRTAEYRIIFSNQSRLRISPNEIAITFGYVDDIPGSPPFVDEKVTLVLTPAHTKLLSVSLEASLKVFEAAYGTIKVDHPPGQLNMGSVRDAVDALSKSK